MGLQSLLYAPHMYRDPIELVQYPVVVIRELNDSFVVLYV